MNLESPMKHAAEGFPEEDELMMILNVDATTVWTRVPGWKKKGEREEPRWMPEPLLSALWHTLVEKLQLPSPMYSFMPSLPLMTPSVQQ